MVGSDSREVSMEEPRIVEGKECQCKCGRGEDRNGWWMERSGFWLAGCACLERLLDG